MHTNKSIIRWCLPVLLVAVMAVPGALGGKPKGCGGSNCVSPPGLTCGNTPTGYTGSLGFSATQFTYSCLGDAGQDCAHKTNSVNPKDPAKSCCSCYLYAAFGAHATPNTLITNKDIKTANHVLLMPSNPCMGVEVWNKPACPGESIWSEGAKLLEGAGKKYDYGMAINPVQRRGMHQMHVHLAKVKDTLMKAITEVHKQGYTSWHVDCGGHSTLSNCHALQKSDTPDPDHHLKVQIFTGAPDPAAVQPFHTVYGSYPKANGGKANVERSSMIVVHVPNAKSTWAVVTNPTGPAESSLDNL